MNQWNQEVIAVELVYSVSVHAFTHVYGVIHCEQSRVLEDRVCVIRVYFFAVLSVK